jgi:hypothetical protein
VHDRCPVIDIQVHVVRAHAHHGAQRQAGVLGRVEGADVDLPRPLTKISVAPRLKLRAGSA